MVSVCAAVVPHRLTVLPVPQRFVPAKRALGRARRVKEVGVRGRNHRGTVGLSGKGAPVVSPPPVGLPQPLAGAGNGGGRPPQGVSTGRRGNGQV